MKKKTTKRKDQFRKSYPEDFKSQAIDLAKELGLRKAVEKLGMPGIQTLAKWVRHERKMTEDAEYRSTEELKKELKSVKKQLAEEQKTVAILKDAAAFFCRENVK